MYVRIQEVSETVNTELPQAVHTMKVATAEDGAQARNRQCTIIYCICKYIKKQTQKKQTHASEIVAVGVHIVGGCPSEKESYLGMCSLTAEFVLLL
jgi:hypothetical protein